MKITMYELLGLIKDGKAPKKIKYKDFIYEYYEKETVIDYRCYDEKTELYGYLSSCVDYETFNILDNEVEIIEEKKIPEKIKIDNEDRIQALSTGNFVYKVNQPTKNIIYKINEIIDFLKSKGDE